MGHDYSHYFSRLLIGSDHVWKNGIFSLPHYTPYLCGGVPFFADPQSIFHSLPQFLAFFLELLPATYLSFLVFYALGYWGMYRLSKESFGLSNLVSHFLSLLFFLNGFSFNHLVIGHITHMPFLLTPWLIYFVLRQRVIFFSLLLIYCVYSGALHILAIWVFLTLILAPYFISKIGKGVLSFLWGVPLILILTCTSKFFAALRYSPQFFMHSVDNSGWGIGKLVSRYFWADVLHTPFQSPFGDWAYGAWEYTAPLSKLTLVLGGLGLLYVVIQNRQKPVLLLTTLCLTLFLLIVSLGTSFNLKVPFLNHYHNPLKLLASLLLPILLLTGMGLEALLKEWKIKKVLLIYFGLGALVLTEFFVSSSFILRNPAALTFRYPGFEFSKIREQGGLPAVTGVTVGGRDDYAMMKNGRTSLTCYEPLLGYRLENLRARMPVGSPNLTHPGCLLYSKELGCEPWSLVSNAFEANRFREGKAVSSWVPGSQTVLNYLNLFALGLLLLVQIPAPNSIRKFGYKNSVRVPVSDSLKA